VALKFLHEEFGANSRALDRFLIEAKSIATLNHHNIVQIHELERSDAGPYIVMEYVGGGSLVDVLQKGPIPLATAIEITCQVCDALAVAHGKGIIHRDIKPANILMTPEGVPKLSDFGLARQQQADHGQTQAGAILGTIDFMPPEQRLDATDVDARSDLWSLAATLYQILTGESPRVIDLSDVPDILRTTLGKALKTKPESRFQDAISFKEALKNSLSLPPPPVSPQPAPQLPVMNDAPSGKPNHCPRCNVAHATGLKFCQECGEKLTRPCPACNVEISVHTKFCGVCGSDASVLPLQGDDYKAYIDRANAYGKQGDFQRALADYETSLTLWADNPDVYVYRGIMFGAMGRQDAAITDFDRAIQLRPDDAVAYCNRGVAYKQWGDFPKALLDLDSAIQLKPGFSEAFSNKGHVHIELGQFDEAIAACDRAIMLKQDNALAYVNRGIAYRKIGDYSRADSDLARARQLGHQP
jgi:serine/threonine protein kinase